MTEATEAAATAPASEAQDVQSQTPAPTAQPEAQPAPVTEPAGEQKPAEQQPQGAPEKYELAGAEGYQLVPERLEKFEGIARELNLTNEQAQKLVGLASEFSQADLAAQEQQQAKQVEAWIGELKQDKDFGGAAFDSNVKIAQKAMADFGTPELREMLDASGLGSHPEVVRFFHRVGQQISEGSVHRETTVRPQPRRDADLLFGDLFKK